MTYQPATMVHTVTVTVARSKAVPEFCVEEEEGRYDPKY